jgi:hypothetical protein
MSKLESHLMKRPGELLPSQQGSECNCTSAAGPPGQASHVGYDGYWIQTSNLVRVSPAPTSGYTVTLETLLAGDEMSPSSCCWLPDWLWSGEVVAARSNESTPASFQRPWRPQRSRLPLHSSMKFHQERISTRVEARERPNLRDDK